MNQQTDQLTQKPANTLPKNGGVNSGSDLVEVKRQILNRGLNRIDSESMGTILGAAIPSFIVLILSFFLDVSTVPGFGRVSQNFANWLFPGSQVMNQSVEPVHLWWYPFLIYIIFIVFAILCKQALRKEITTKGASEGGISRIIDRYSGLVDGIGTALPLIGAAILLISIKEGPTVFIGFSVPFEVKSIAILAIAKLFESVFDAQALQYQELQEEMNNVETEYYQTRSENIQNAMLAELRSMNGRSGGATTDTVYQGLSPKDFDDVRKILVATNTVNEALTKNIIAMKSALGDLKNVATGVDSSSGEVQKLTAEITSIIKAAERSTEFTNIVRQNADALRGIAKELNDVKIFQNSDAVKELQTLTDKMNTSMAQMKDANVQKTMDSLAYIAGKRQ